MITRKKEDIQPNTQLLQRIQDEVIKRGNELKIGWTEIVKAMSTISLDCPTIYSAEARSGKTNAIKDMCLKVKENDMFSMVITPDQSNLPASFINKTKKYLNIVYLNTQFKKVTKPKKHEINKLCKRIKEEKLCIICLSKHMGLLIEILETSKLQGYVCIDEADDVYGMDNSQKLRNLNKLLQLVDERCFLVTATEQLLTWNSKLFKKQSNRYRPVEDEKFFSIKNKKIKTYEMDSIDDICNVIPKCSSYKYKNKKDIIGCCIIADYYKSGHLDIMNQLKKKFPKSIFIISNGKYDKIYSPQFKGQKYSPQFNEIKGQHVLEQTMVQVHELLNDDNLLNNIDYMFVIGYNKVLRGISPRSEFPEMVRDWRFMLLCTNLIYIARSNNTDHSTINQALKRLQGMYPGDTCPDLRVFTTKACLESLQAYHDLQDLEYADFKEKDGLKQITPLPLENYTVDEKFADRPAYGKRKQTTICINDVYYPTKESQEKAHINNTIQEFDKQEIQRKFENWSVGNTKNKTKITQFIRKLDPEKVYTKDDLHNLMKQATFFNTSTILNKLQTDTNSKNGYGLILQKLPDQNYRIYPELVDDFKKIILKIKN